MRGAKASIEVLRSDEGRELRQRHGRNVRYLRNKLFEAGVAAVHTPSHIIPIHVSVDEISSYFLRSAQLLEQCNPLNGSRNNDSNCLLMQVWS